MTNTTRLLFVFALPLAAACQGTEPAQEADERTSSTATAMAETGRPMPPSAERIARVLAEIGAEASTLEEPLRMQEERLVLARRDALAALSPRVRAAMVRHNVRVEELARHLAGGAQ